MGWFRVNRKWSGSLALFALALQLTLSFAHSHSSDAPAPTASIQTQATEPDASHQDGDHGRIAHDDCAICVTIHLASTLVLSPPPAIAPPVDATPAWRITAARFSTAVRLHLPQARAPPQA
ncbi:MAG: DUF2946 family protein [Hyphomicrobiales bacterium]